MNQEQWLEGCRQNDKVAQMKIYDLYCQAMFQSAFNMVKDDMLAQDLMQEAFLKAFSKIDTFNEKSTFGAWLKRIVINQCLDHLKRKNRLDTVEIKEDLHYLDEAQDWTVEDSISLNRIYQCIEDLPSKCKHVVKLYLLEGYDHQEVAEILQISEVASRSQLSRGKNRLRELLREGNYES